jgi:hypothetical protein
MCPFRSIAQMRFFNTNKSKLEKQGVDVEHWNKSSKGNTSRLAYHVTKHKKKK